MKKLPWITALLLAVFAVGCTSPQLRQDAATATAATAGPYMEDKLAHGRALTAEDVVLLSKKGVPDEVILRNFRASWAIYNLDVETVEHLKASGVSDTVVNAMLASRQSYGGPARYYARVGYYGYYPRGYGFFGPRHFRPHRGHHRHRHHRHHH